KMSAQSSARALELADQCFRDRKRWLPLHERAQILHKAAQLLQEKRDEVVRTALLEGGKPLTDTRIEIDRAIDGLRNCAELLRTDQGEVVPMGYTAASAGHIAFTQREPIGPVLALSAFNHPINLVVHQIGPAIAAGCPVLIKPASKTPLSCIKLLEILYEAGLPPVWCQLLVPENHSQ